jgi:hypothetical protein
LEDAKGALRLLKRDVQRLRRFFKKEVAIKGPGVMKREKVYGGGGDLSSSPHRAFHGQMPSWTLPGKGVIRFGQPDSQGKDIQNFIGWMV